MPLERFQKFAAGDVPQMHVPRNTGHCQGLAVRRKGHTLDHAPSRLIGILERLHPLPGRGGPEDSRPVAAAAGQQLSVLREVERNTESRVSIQGRISRRLATSQTFSGLGEPPGLNHHFEPKPATRYFPSGENASAPTTLTVPVRPGSRADRSLPAIARVLFRHRCPTARHRKRRLVRRTRQPAGGCRWARMPR